MELLVLGGTSFAGRHVVDQAEPQAQVDGEGFTEEPISQPGTVTGLRNRSGRA